MYECVSAAVGVSASACALPEMNLFGLNKKKKNPDFLSQGF